MEGVLLGKLLTVFQIWPGIILCASYIHGITVIFNAGNFIQEATKDLLNNSYILRRYLKISHFSYSKFQSTIIHSVTDPLSI